MNKAVPQRFQEGVIQWMREKGVVDEIEKIDRSILKKCKEVQLELEIARVIIMGRDDEEENTKGSEGSTIVTDAFIVVVAIVLSPIIIIDMLLTKLMGKKKIDTSYTACAELFTKEEIQNRLDSVFQDHFKHRIKSIFEKELPRKIATITCTIKILCLEKQKIREKINVILRLRDSLCKIKGDLETFT